MSLFLSGGSRICQGGSTWGARGARAYKTVIWGWGRAPCEVQGQAHARAPGEGSGGEAPLKVRAFCLFSYKKVAKSEGFK